MYLWAQNKNQKKFALVAQWIEQKFPKLLVGGSIPLEGTDF